MGWFWNQVVFPEMMQSVLIHPRVLILAPFYFYHGLFFSFFTSIIPTAFQFTKVSNIWFQKHSKLRYFPLTCIYPRSSELRLPRAASPVGLPKVIESGKLLSVSLITMKFSCAVHNFCLTYLMFINCGIHLVRFRIFFQIFFLKIWFFYSGNLRNRRLRDSAVEHGVSEWWPSATCATNVRVVFMIRPWYESCTNFALGT